MSTGSELLEVLNALTAVEWGRCSTADDAEHATRPPMTAWRFSQEKPELEGAVERAVRGFKGNARWTIWREGHNWVVQPEAVATYLRRNEFQNDVEMAIAFGRDHPDIVRQAFEDMPRLAEHVKQQVQS